MNGKTSCLHVACPNIKRFVTIHPMQAELLLRSIGIQYDHATANMPDLHSFCFSKDEECQTPKNMQNKSHARMIGHFQGHQLGRLVFHRLLVTALWPRSSQGSIDLRKILKQCWQLSTWSGTGTSERSTKFLDIGRPHRR